MEDFDTTEPEKTESERQADLIATLDGLLAQVLQRLARLEDQVGTLEVQVADLHHTRRVGRQQATDQDAEWY